MPAVPITLEEWKARARTFEGIHDRSPDGMMMFRAVRHTGAIVDFEWLYCNPSASRIVGRAPDELTGKRLLVEMPGNKEGPRPLVSRHIDQARRRLLRGV